MIFNKGLGYILIFLKLKSSEYILIHTEYAFELWEVGYTLSRKIASKIQAGNCDYLINRTAPFV